jgi:hypothetical protein
MHSTSDDQSYPAGGTPELPPHTPRSTLSTLTERFQRWGVPGFRSGVRWKQWAAAIGYALIFLVLLSGVVTPDGYVVALGLLALVWVLLVTNGWGLRQRVPVFRSPDKRVVAAGWIGLAAVSLIALGAAGQAGEERRERTPQAEMAALTPRSTEVPTSPTTVMPVSATAPALAVPTQQATISTSPPGSPRPTSPTPTPTARPSPTPDDRPARLYELVVGSYRGTSKEFLIDGLTPDSFKFDGSRVIVKTDWYPDNEAKEWAVGFCNTIATFRNEFGYTAVQVHGQGNRTLARSENRGRDRQGNPILVCRKA